MQWSWPIRSQETVNTRGSSKGVNAEDPHCRKIGTTAGFSAGNEGTEDRDTYFSPLPAACMERNGMCHMSLSVDASFKSLSLSPGSLLMTISEFEFEPYDRNLPTTLNGRIRSTYACLGQHLKVGFEQFQTSILTSKSPEDEAILWSGVSAVWADYQRKYLAGKPPDIECERSIVAALIAISTGEQELSRLPVSFEVATSLLSCYVDLADELPFSRIGEACFSRPNTDYWRNGDVID